MFTRIAIVNRGEAAMRLIHAVRDLNAHEGSEGNGSSVRTIALYTDDERTAMFAREADEAFGIGPASARPYIDHAVLERALLACRADAVWVGWGFVAEDPAFADLCARIGVTFIGPNSDAMRKLGDKIGSKLIAEDVGVPVAPWSGGEVATLAEALEAADRIGYPLMLKATAGGGGRGIRMVASAADLEDAYLRTREEAERAFGNGAVFLERLVTGARHVEVQVIADGQGTAWAIGVRDCTVQRRNQKVIEESASPLLDEGQAGELKAAAERLAIAVGYAGAGTVEFLYHPGERTFAFLEVNTRLQVEHPITEVTTDIDLVKAQIRIAAGEKLTGDRPAEKGHAVEARLNAEDPDRDFAPAPGRIALLELPNGPGIRVDTGVGEGDLIPADFDSMIAKIIAYGPTRDEALARLRRAMAETTVVIEGGATNKSFILDLLQQPEVVGPKEVDEADWADTGWIDRARAAGGLVLDRHAGVALAMAGIEAYADEARVEISRLLETAHGGRPQVQHRVGRPVDFKLRGVAYKVTVIQTGPRCYRITVACGELSERFDAELERRDEFHVRLTIGGQTFRLVTATHAPTHFIEVDGVAHRVSRDEGGVLRSPAPALVVASPVVVGDVVEAGSPVLVLESMKMETVLRAPFDATVRELLVLVGGQVETGAPLVRLEPAAVGDEGAGEPSAGTTEDGAAAGADRTLDLPGAAPDLSPGERAERALADVSAQIMGFDLDPVDSNASMVDYLAARADLLGQNVDVLSDELAFLAMFADFAELSRNRPVGEDLHTELRVHSPREHFHTYLHSLDVERGGLPASFCDRLTRVLDRYGVSGDARTPELEEAVFRIFLAQQRPGTDVRLVSAVLERWMAEPPPAPELAVPVRDLLERLVRATQLRHPVIGDLARSIRFRWFDQPLVDVERETVLAHVRDRVAELTDDPDLPDRAARIEALAAIPEQIVRFLVERLQAGVEADEPMLEVMVRRHYREHDLRDVRSTQRDGRPFAVADYTVDDKPTRLVTTLGTMADLSDPSGSFGTGLAAEVAARQPGTGAVVDLYLHWADAPDSDDDVASGLNAVLGGLPFAHDVRRITVGVSSGAADATGGVTYFTFRSDGAGSLTEDDLVRGVHRMVARRLNLWRLQNFDVTRLDAPDDVLLYECVAKESPQDRRLVALAQVRQLAVVRDEDGVVVGLPHAERAIENCLEAIRRTRTARGAAGTKLDMNHIWVQVWPVVDADLDQLAALQSKITPLSDGAGIEEVLVQGRVAGPEGPTSLAMRFHARPGAGTTASVEEPPTEPLKALDDYASKVVRSRRRGMVYPYELEGVLSGVGGSVVEHDLDDAGVLVPVDRPRGLNKAGIMAAVVTTPTALYPEGVTRVVLCGDPTAALGAVSEPECTRIIAAIDLAERMQVPVEWFAISAGARISMDSGTENMDWVASALKRIVEFTQAGGEINVVVAGINVGAQPYWNAEATMLMHTKGILVMTPDSAMVLTGKQSLDFSGGVSAEDNFGIGGYDRVMGPNGQAQYWAPDLAGAFGVLMAHYEHTYVIPGESGPRRATTSDPSDRDISDFPHELPDSEFSTVGEIFSATANPDRKKPFDIRTVMRALADQDHPTLERWAGMADADTAVVQDAHLGGYPVTILGIESKPVPRRGFPPADGPDIYTAGTLFPRSSKKAARAINAASGNRPVVVLANLSGFDGSPDSMRNLQLEYGAEIGRAIVNFDGPIVFCVISRYHGGAFVVFSKALNPRMTVLALEGSYASVIGGAPAAAVVFAGEVDKRTSADKRVVELQGAVASATGPERSGLVVELADVKAVVRPEKITEVAAEFDGVHDIHRAVRVGSVDEVITVARLRGRVIEAIEADGQRD